MKTIARTFILTIIAGAIFTSCSEFNLRIDGEGPIVTETLFLDDITSISMSGVSDLYLSYGSEQNVVVEGHDNIIGRIKREVTNGKWYMELEDGNYGLYDLTYYVTLPYIENLDATGTGDVIVDNEWQQDYFDLVLDGTGSFLGFSFSAKRCNLAITGTGNCEITAEEELDIILDGTGSVYYKGTPVINSDVTGTGSIVSMN